MPGGFAHHLAAHRHPAGEKDVVKLLVQQRLILGPAALHHRGLLGGKAVRDQPAQHGRAGGGVGGWLDHAAVARRDRPDQRAEGEQKRVVPGGHDQHHPVGVGRGKAAGVELGQRGGHPHIPHPAGQMLLGKGELGEGQPHLAEKALGAGLAKVGREGRADLLLPGLDGRLQPGKRRLAGLTRQGGPGGKKGPLAADKGFDLHLRNLLFRKYDPFAGIVPCSE